MKTKVLIGLTVLGITAALATPARAGLSFDFRISLPLPVPHLPVVVCPPPVPCPPPVVVARPVCPPPPIAWPAPAPCPPPVMVVYPPRPVYRPVCVPAPVVVFHGHGHHRGYRGHH